jgi:transposase
VGISIINLHEESDMNASTVAVDLAKSVFQLAVADERARVIETHRLTRAQFARWFDNRAVGLVVMEACGSAHHWARTLIARGIAVKLLPPAYVRAYVRRNKTDAADAAALLEASRCSDMHPVPVKSVEQQALQGLHRIRSLWMSNRTSRINTLRGLCREFGLAVSVGSRLGVEQISRVLAEPKSPIPELIRSSMSLLVEEIRLLESRVAGIERELSALAKHSAACVQLMSIPGVGLLTATAMVAATSGKVTHFKDARAFASWFGLTPREFSSGNSRHLGGISKRGDRYLRMLMTHGARSVLRAATVAKNQGKTLSGLRLWSLGVQGRSNHNKATCALANKIARICYATLRDGEAYRDLAANTERTPRPEKKLNRESFAMPC